MTGQGRRVTGRKAGLGLGTALLLWLVVTPLTALATNDPGFTPQWSLTGGPASINAPQAWCASTGLGVLVADFDTSADFGHPDLAGKLTPGAAFLNGDGTQSGKGAAAVQDGNGHDSMTTGLIAASTRTGAGIAAVAPGSHALIIKVLDNSGSGSANDVAAGIRYAADAGARVINLSIGSDLRVLANLLCGSPIPAAIDYAYHRGSMVAAAAGNTSYASSDYAGIASEALVVGALDRNGNRASYSTAGNIYAPSGDGNTEGAYYWVLSTVNGGGYGIGTGTSVAAPEVAGTLALLMAQGYSATDARQRILATAANRNGLPELDAAAAVSPSPTASPSPSPSPSPLFGVIPSNGPDVAPGTTLASAPPSGPPAPLVLVAATLVVGAAVGYGGSWGVMLARRLRAAPDPGAPSG